MCIIVDSSIRGEASRLDKPGAKIVMAVDESPSALMAFFTYSLGDRGCTAMFPVSPIANRFAHLYLDRLWGVIFAALKPVLASRKIVIACVLGCFLTNSTLRLPFTDTKAPFRQPHSNKSCGLFSKLEKQRVYIYTIVSVP